MDMIVKFNYIYLMQQIQRGTCLNTAHYDQNIIVCQLQSVHDLCEVKQIFNDGKQAENPTTEGNQETQVVRVKSLSKKKLRRNLEISFEKYFLKEHQAVFRWAYQNYVESIKLINGDKKLQSVPEAIFESQPHYPSNQAINLLKANENKLSLTQKDQFFKDLQHEQKLHEFLNIVAKHCSPNMVMGLLQLAYHVWMKFVPNQHQELKLSWLIQFGQEVGRQSISNFCMKNWSFELKEEHYLLQSFAEFIQIYCVTILLIVSDYFQNPYSENEEKSTPETKRTFQEFIFSDSDDLSEFQSIIISRKMRKGA